MVKYFKYGLMILGILMICFTILEVKNCYEKTSQDNTHLKGLVQRYKTEVEEVKKKKEQMEERIAKRDERIKQYTQDIVDLQYESHELENQMEAESKELKELKEKFNLLEDKDKQIQNLTSQVQSLEQMFALAKKNIKVLKKEAHKWKLAYREQVGISANLRKQLTRQEQASEVADSLIDNQSKKIKKLKRQKILYQIGCGVAVGLGLLLGGD